MENKNAQKIKGDGNTQIIVNYNVGLDKNEVIIIIQSFGYVNKDEIVEIERGN